MNKSETSLSCKATHTHTHLLTFRYVTIFHVHNYNFSVCFRDASNTLVVYEIKFLSAIFFINIRLSLISGAISLKMGEFDKLLLSKR